MIRKNSFKKKQISNISHLLLCFYCCQTDLIISIYIFIFNQRNIQFKNCRGIMKATSDQINEQIALIIIKKIKDQQEREYKLESLIDSSQGVDQQVKICTFTQVSDKKVEQQRNKRKKQIKQKKQTIVIKYPKEEPDKILHERIGCRYAGANGVPVPQIYYYDKEYLAQQYIVGQRLSSIKTSKKNYGHLYKQLGQYLKKIHINVGTGFGKLKDFDKLAGEHKDKSQMLKNLQQQVRMLQERAAFSPKFMLKLKQYLVHGIRFFTYQQNYTSLLHGDYHQDNIIATNKQIKGIIDFGDLSMGAPMQDFARLYVKHHGTQIWDHIVEGYGGKQYIDNMQLQFYVIYLCLWQMNGLLQKGEAGGKLRKLEKAVKKIIGYKM